MYFLLSAPLLNAILLSAKCLRKQFSLRDSYVLFSCEHGALHTIWGVLWGNVYKSYKSTELILVSILRVRNLKVMWPYMVNFMNHSKRYIPEDWELGILLIVTHPWGKKYCWLSFGGLMGKFAFLSIVYQYQHFIIFLFSYNKEHFKDLLK